MARNRHQFERRKREQARKERAEARRARKRNRASARGEDGVDPDLEAIVPGPQPREKLSDAEVQRAVERAMSPSTAGRRTARAESDGAPMDSRLFVGNLDFGTDERELREAFAQAGFTLIDATVVRDRHTGDHKGFAFVQLTSSDEATRAMETMDGEQLSGRTLRVKPAEKSRR